MPLLPTARRLAEGGALSLDPNDPTLPADPVARQRELQRRQNLQGRGSTTGEQVGQGVQQAASAASALSGITGTAGAASAAGASGLAGVAGAAGPIGAAVVAGAAIGGALHKSNLEDDGLRNTSIGGQIKDTLANTLDPIGTATSAWSDDKLNVGQKIISSIPGIGSVANSFFTKKTVDVERLKQQAKLQQQAIDQSGQQSRSVYGGLAESTRPQYGRGGLLPTRLAGGGSLTLPRRPSAATSAPPPVLTAQQQQARKYYDNIVPTLDKMLAGKYDEQYTPVGSKQACTSNSCVSFANSAQEQALGMAAAPRDKAHLYNPEFAHSASAQGWQKVPLAELRAGDRVQRWKPAATSTNGAARQADLQGTDYYAGGQPTHMMIFGGYQNQGEKGVGANANFYEDGLSDQPARKRVGPLEGNAVAYRYMGVGGQPTNNPAEAVAARSVASPGAARPSVAMRAKGGLLPGDATKSVIAHGALHSEKNTHAGHATAGKRGIPVLAADGTKLAEVERDELTLTDTATQKLEKLRQQGNLLGLGKHLQKELLTNTVPSPRYAKRLLPTR